MTNKSLFYDNVRDLVQGIELYNIWKVSALLDMKRKYRRSLIGTSWITLNLVVLIGGMAVVFGALFGQPLATFIPYVAAGMIHWQLIAFLINDGAEHLINAKSKILQYNVPISVHCYQHLFKSLLTFFHTGAVLVILIVCMPVDINYNTLMYPIGLVLIFLNGLWLSLLLGAFSLRYRDLPMLTTNIVQACFFITPIFWKAESLNSKIFIAYLNPFYHFLEITRGPALGRMPSWESYAVVAGITTIGLILSIWVWGKKRHLLPYYL
tara:strand:+ start:241 stop:1038 length:798 start_codon:yes stop_codon:yes gene_type:complete